MSLCVQAQHYIQQADIKSNKLEGSVKVRAERLVNTVHPCCDEDIKHTMLVSIPGKRDSM